MAVNVNDIVYREWPNYTHFWLTGALEKVCGANPIEMPPGTTVAQAAARFDAQIADLKDRDDLQKFYTVPMPLDIARAADERMQQMLAEMTDIHNTLKQLNLFAGTGNASINNAANTKAATLQNALIAYRQHWIDNPFTPEQTAAQADRASWKTALKTFVTNNFGQLDWLRF